MSAELHQMVRDMAIADRNQQLSLRRESLAEVNTALQGIIAAEYTHNVGARGCTHRAALRECYDLAQQIADTLKEEMRNHATDIYLAEDRPN
jgi:hypothetical protein